MAKQKIRSSDASFANLRADAKSSGQMLNGLWRVAHKSQGFLRKPKIVNKKRATQKDARGKHVPVPQRLNKTIRRFPLRVMLSAAAARVGATLATETKQLRVDAAGEVNVSGALPSISKGAELMIEKFLISYCKTAMSNAVAIRDTMNMHKTLTEGSMLAACEILNGEMRTAAGIAPGALLLDKRNPKRKATAKATEEPEEEATTVAASN